MAINHGGERGLRARRYLDSSATTNLLKLASASKICLGWHQLELADFYCCHDECNLVVDPPGRSALLILFLAKHAATEDGHLSYSRGTCRKVEWKH
jgi:hypothetical protein